MEIKKLQKIVNDKLGIEVEFDEEEAAFLIEFAINHLLAIGSAEYINGAYQEEQPFEGQLALGASKLN